MRVSVTARKKTSSVRRGVCAQPRTARLRAAAACHACAPAATAVSIVSPQQQLFLRHTVYIPHACKKWHALFIDHKRDAGQQERARARTAYPVRRCYTNERAAAAAAPLLSSLKAARQQVALERVEPQRGADKPVVCDEDGIQMGGMFAGGVACREPGRGASKGGGCSDDTRTCPLSPGRLRMALHGPHAWPQTAWPQVRGPRTGTRSRRRPARWRCTTRPAPTRRARRACRRRAGTSWWAGPSRPSPRGRAVVVCCCC